MIGRKDGPVAEAFAKAKAVPAAGHEPLFAILEPNLAVKPMTLIVPTVTITSMRQASMVYGPAQTAVAKAVVDCVTDGTIPRKAVEDIMIMANVFVHPTAVDRQRVTSTITKLCGTRSVKRLKDDRTSKSLSETRIDPSIRSSTRRSDALG
jgi:formaldehyde-activating enzyme